MLRKAQSALDALLATGSRQEFLAASGAWPVSISLPDARKLTSHLGALAPPVGELRLGFVRTYTSDLLDPWLELHAAAQGFACRPYHAPYGLGLSEARPGSGLVSHAPDLTLFLLTREDLHPDLARGGGAWDEATQEALSTAIAERLCEIIGHYREVLGGQLVLSVLPQVMSPALGLFDTQAEGSRGLWWSRTKAAIASAFRERLQSTLLLDMDDVLAEVGRARFFDLRYWYASRYPFAAPAADEFARRIIALGTVASTPRAKVIALDADNTLWGGIVGEDGPEGIALGPEHPGSAYAEFQRRILDYQQRGFILALCSKNNPEDVDEILASHPHQVLRDEHFAARRVNWLPKHENLISLAEELNLGLDSFVFVDDSDHECAIVRRELPMVTVVQTPRKPAQVPRCLERVARLEVLSLTSEDVRKTQLYAQERKRRTLKDDFAKQGGDMGDYLASLEMKMRVSMDDATHLRRLSQLTQKTNQFNLTARRYDEQQMLGFIESGDCLVSSFSLSDVFGDSGVVGLAIMSGLTGGDAQLDSFLVSCRVIGRRAESAFMAATLTAARQHGVYRVLADFIPTRKNRLVESFLPEHGFTIRPDGRYERDLEQQPPEAASSYPIELVLDPA